jgi:hypothetical protein
MSSNPATPDSIVNPPAHPADAALAVMVILACNGRELCQRVSTGVTLRPTACRPATGYRIPRRRQSRSRVPVSSDGAASVAAGGSCAPDLDAEAASRRVRGRSGKHAGSCTGRSLDRARSAAPSGTRTSGRHVARREPASTLAAIRTQGAGKRLLGVVAGAVGMFFFLHIALNLLIAHAVCGAAAVRRGHGDRLLLRRPGPAEVLERAGMTIGAVLVPIPVLRVSGGPDRGRERQENKTPPSIITDCPVM